MTVFQIKLTTISPVHIGNGNILRSGYDYHAEQGYTRRLHIENILEKTTDEWQAHLNNPSTIIPAALLKRIAAQEQPGCLRYSLRGEPRSSKNFSELREQIKDVYDRPYIPGSSLKGVLRTALAWHAWEERKLSLDLGRLGRQAKFAAQPYEKELFGKDPNYDLMRVLQVSDLQGEKDASSSLLVVNAQVLGQKQLGSPIELEAIRAQQVFRGSLTRDDVLLDGRGDYAKLGFASRKDWFRSDTLLSRLRTHSQARLDDIIRWLGKVEQGSAINAFYQGLRTFPLTSQQALIQLGWGAGWDSKTFYTRLKNDNAVFARLINNYRMQIRPAGAGPFPVGGTYPATRRVILSKGAPAAPFGWCLLEVVAGDKR